MALNTQPLNSSPKKIKAPNPEQWFFTFFLSTRMSRSDPKLPKSPQAPLHHPALQCPLRTLSKQAFPPTGHADDN